jgi:L-malate glycosyltransferase
MKIAFITNYWKNSGGGGVENFLVNLVDAMRSKGIYTSVLYREGNDLEQFYGGRNKFIFSLTCYMQLRKVRPEVIHSQGTWYCLLPGVLYKKLHGCVLVHTFHTESEKLPRLSKVIFQSLLKVCDCVTFVSKSIRKQMIEVNGYSFHKTAITYAGVRIREVTDDEVERFREQFVIGEGAIILLAQAMTSNPLKVEGLKQLIMAVRKLRENYPDIVLIITRKGKYSDIVKAFVSEVGVEEQIVMTEDVKNPFVPLKISDLYTHITLMDGVPLALLEAMSMGKPIVATPMGGVPEVITDGENGVLVAPDAEQIANKIDFLLRNRAYAEGLGICAKRTVEENFTWELATEHFLSIMRGTSECTVL